MKIAGNDILIQSLINEGVEYIFGYPGGAALHIYDSIFNQKEMQHILVRHEQGATHAADGYARATGKPGVVLVTSDQAQQMLLQVLQQHSWIQYQW